MSGVAIVCCAKLEDPYLVEWITYNIKGLGFDAIYIYDNNAKQETTPALLDAKLDPETRAKVHLNWDPNNDRLFFRATAHWVANYKHLYKAVAVIDPDEFLALYKHPTIHAFLEEYLYPYGGALGVNWVFFGNNQLTEPDDRPVTQRFTRRQKGVNEHVKSIVMCKDFAGMVNPHFPHLLNGTQQRDTSGRTFRGAFNPGAPADAAELFHYWCKTFPEWMIRRDKGHIDINPNSRRPLDLFDQLNFNDVEDTRLWQRIAPLLNIHDKGKVTPKSNSGKLL